VEGQHVVILGRSNVVGKPLSLMMLERNATVTVCHRHTRNLMEHTSRADIVVAAMGNPNFLSCHHLRPDAVVIDVGVTAVPDDTKPRGYRLAVNFFVRSFLLFAF
jgi:methylenetetrahydrofolate dehydrogenase (NADP+)/methenyltetrahydrofolate cyclohydrolase